MLICCFFSLRSLTCCTLDLNIPVMYGKSTLAHKIAKQSHSSSVIIRTAHTKHTNTQISLIEIRWIHAYRRTIVEQGKKRERAKKAKLTTQQQQQCQWYDWCVTELRDRKYLIDWNFKCYCAFAPFIICSLVGICLSINLNIILKQHASRSTAKPKIPRTTNLFSVVLSNSGV